MKRKEERGKSAIPGGHLLAIVAGTVIAAGMLMGGVACGDDGGDAAGTTPVIDPGDGGEYSVALDAADFVERINNPYLPFIPRSSWVYEGENEDGELERIEIVVLEETRQVMGISATIVRDTVTVDGELVEDTYDWYAQDKDGNVWYLGEDSTEYEDGEAVSTAGSWEAGADGALPGIIMRAEPAAGDVYRQEYYEGEAEDMAEVARTGVSQTVAFGAFDEVLVIKEWTPLEPDIVEEKYYARGVGVILEEIAGEEGRVQLISFTGP